MPKVVCSSSMAIQGIVVTCFIILDNTTLPRNVEVIRAGFVSQQQRLSMGESLLRMGKRDSDRLKSR